MFSKLRELWQDFKARLRGERRVAPAGARGRVYAPVSARPPGVQAAVTEPKPELQVRVYRSAEQAWYRYNPEALTLVKE
jgi:hypothetical protein